MMFKKMVACVEELRKHPYSVNNRRSADITADLLGLSEELNEAQKEAISILRLMGIGYPSRKDEEECKEDLIQELMDVILYTLNILEREYNDQMIDKIIDRYKNIKLDRFDRLLNS